MANGINLTWELARNSHFTLLDPPILPSSSSQVDFLEVSLCCSSLYIIHLLYTYTCIFFPPVRTFIWMYWNYNDFRGNWHLRNTVIASFHPRTCCFSPYNLSKWLSIIFLQDLFRNPSFTYRFAIPTNHAMPYIDYTAIGTCVLSGLSLTIPLICLLEPKLHCFN